MKSFLINLLIICLCSVSIIFLILSNANGYTDPYYVRFTTPKQQSLILGTSRAAQGIQPKIFKESINLDIFNYSFSNAQSPFGPIYFESIKKKLDENTKNGIFIVTIDPWNISSKSSNPDDIKTFRENELCLNNTTLVSCKPNFQYLIKNLSGRYWDVLLNKKGPVFLHEDGWLEVSVAMDSSTVKRRIDSKVKNYRDNELPYYKLSSVRLKYLEKTILFLKNYGKVYLVRLPLNQRMMQIENRLMPDFNERINYLVPLTDGYYDMTALNSRFDYTDGNHLSKLSGEVVTLEIINWIKTR